jgi:hypothetical protein
VKAFGSILLALGAFAAAAPLAAQRPPPVVGSVAGTVVTAATGQPVPYAVVVLDATADAAVVSSSSSAFLGRSLVAVTDGAGAYRFSQLSPGQYLLLVRHLGYQPAVVAVDLAQAVPFRISVALVVNPIRLEPVESRGTTNEPYARLRTVADERRYGGLVAEQFRDERFLEGDATVVTHAAVTDAVTLGETDLFRAVQRLPGVAARDDFTAALWTRGAPWSQTRVYFDGLPLLNPVHAIGVFSGVNPDAIGAATFHPGARPSAIGEGAAGVLNVTSRRPTRPGLSGLAEVSVISARAAASWQSAGGRTGLVVTGRRSYADIATRIARSFSGDSTTYIPYAFHDLSGRFDADLGRGVALEASGLLEEDDVHGSVRNLLRATDGQWGNRLGRISLTTPLGAVRARTSIGVSAFDGRLGPHINRTAMAAPAPQHAPTSNRVTMTTLVTEFAPATGATRTTWSAGLQMAWHRQDFAGQYPRPYPVIVLPDTLDLRERLSVFSMWGERRWGLGRHAAVEAGLRAEFHEPVRNAPAANLAPKLSARATIPGTHLTFTGALQRSWQYTQALAPAGPSIGPDLYVTDVWLLAGDTIPALRADIATVGAEAWLGTGWTAAVNLFARHTTGMAVPEPAFGALNNQRPIFVSAVNRAHGVELSARRLVGSWTASAAYTYGRSTLRAASGYPFGASYHYPSSADRRHAVDLTLMAHLGQAWRVGAAFSAASGAPYSRFLLGLAPCDTTTVPASCSPTDTAALQIELPNAQRAPGYASLDLLLDWSHTLRSGLRLGAYLQVRNVLNRANAVTYTGSVERCVSPHPPTLVEARAGVCDQFSKGVPVLPLAGLRVSF